MAMSSPANIRAFASPLCVSRYRRPRRSPPIKTALRVIVVLLLVLWLLQVFGIVGPEIPRFR
jgi:hypothetical protein